MLAVAAAFTREMRIGSLEITAGLAVVALLTAQPRLRAATEIGTLTPMQLALDIFERGGRSSREVKAPCFVGRGRDAGLTLNDPEASRRHARLSTHDGLVYLEDCKSRNGTFLNGRRIAEALELREGDEIDVGTTRIVVKSVRPA